MALKMNLSEGTGDAEMWTADRHLYLTEDGSRVVEEGDPAGRWLWAGPGTEVPKSDAEKLGAIPAETKQRAQPEDKAAAKPANKAAQRPADKGRDGKGGDDGDS